MDWTWLSQLLAWVIAINDAISNFAAVFGFITLLAAAAGYLITRIIRDPFGNKVPVGPRYRRFYESLAVHLSKRNPYLLPPSDIKGTPACIFTTQKTKGQGVTYRVHFLGDANFSVYLRLAGQGAPALFHALEQQHTRSDLTQRLGLEHRHFLRRPTAESLKFEPPNGSPGYKIAVYYAGGGVIGADARQLRLMRKWAVRRLSSFQKVFDDLVPSALLEINTQPALAHPVVSSVN